MDTETCGLQTGKDKGLIWQATLWLEGAVTWQPGDHISEFACACVSCVSVCVCARVGVRPIQAAFEDNVLFLAQQSFTLQQFHTAQT